VLDPFAGGGAIPLEAMRLGCEVTAVDINPVAWFILKCTLEYPQKLAGHKRRLPDFALVDRELMDAFFKAQGLKGALLRTRLQRLGLGEDPAPQLTGIEAGDPLLEADLAWHVRAWGRWVLARARKDLARFYPTYAEFEQVDGSPRDPKKSKDLQVVPLDEVGRANVDALNAEFGEAYLADRRNMRWVAKPAVAYLWARTVACKNCRAIVPLLKTRWLCKKDNKRVLLTMEPNKERTGVVFGIDENVAVVGANAAARREHDKRMGSGTMSRSGAKCPCCGTILETQDIRLEGRVGRLGAMITAVVVDAQSGKDYRLPTDIEILAEQLATGEVSMAFAEVPFGVPTEPIAKGSSRTGGGSAFTVSLYGLDQWHKLFTHRQLVALAKFVTTSRDARNYLQESGYPQDWKEAISGYLALAVDRLADRGSSICSWTVGWDKIRNTFVRYALPITWDFAESTTMEDSSGGYPGAIEWISRYIEHAIVAAKDAPLPLVQWQSAISVVSGEFDVVLTDPPYYDAIPYADLMDFFYVWLRRVVGGISPEIDRSFTASLSPKWDHGQSDGELIDDASRFGGDKDKSRRAYEEGMLRAFQASFRALKQDGRLVVVFAHKHPDAWDALVSAIIRAGFVVDGSWPIQTEMGNRTRALTSAALSSSVWLVCRKRPKPARPGWDNRVLEEMHRNITVRLREFWDAGIRGPDFVWAATGPALEAYSQHPAVRKANNPGELMKVSEFLKHVRRIVVDFVVGRVLLGEASSEEASGLDDVTSYYLLHRHDFGLEEAPAGTCILYALSCGLSDRDLADQYDLLVRTGGKDEAEAEDEAEEVEGEEEGSKGSGSRVKLKPWQQRKGRSLGYESSGGRTAPLIDQVHRLMHLWKSGEVVKVNEYLDARALRQNKMFHHLLQALIELAPHASEERSLLESISNHVVARGVAPQEELRL